MTYHSDTLAFKKSELLEILQAIDSSFSFDAVLKTTNDNNKAFPIQEATVTQPQSFIDYKSFLFKKPLLSIHEAACIISEDDPNTVTRCEHDTNFDQNFNNYLHAFNFVDAAIKANDLACDDSQFYGIKNTDLKNYLISTGIIVDGFTDTIPAQNQSNFGTPAIQQTIPNIENYTKEIESLKAALDQAQVRIKELEAKQAVEQLQIQTNELESKLSTREENNILRVLAVLADMEKKIDISKPYEAHGIMLAKANLLGIEPFPSNESIKKWFSKANEFKNPN